MSRTIQENEAILKQFRDWLEQTIEEVDALDPTSTDEMPKEQPKSDVSVQEATDTAVKNDEGPVNFTACALSPAAWTENVTQFNETIRLDRVEHPAQPKTAQSKDELNTAGDSLPKESAAPLPEIGLRQLVEAFTAMRHETKLQTKSTRGVVDAVQSSLAGLDAAMRQFQATPEEGAREKEATIPLIEALVELDEALLRGARAFETTTQTAPERLEEMLDELFQGLPWWHRWTARLLHGQIRHRCIKTMERINTEDFAHLKEGYALIQGRFQRVLRERGVHRIKSVGRHVDPEEMNVVELVNSPEAEPETVVEEVRPGYKWRDRVIRFAEVRAVGGHRRMATGDEYCHEKSRNGNRMLEISPLERDANSRSVSSGRE